MGRSARGSLGKRNFGLTGKSQQDNRTRSTDSYSNWFWESKSQKKLREDQKREEIERSKTERLAMQQLMTEQDNPNQGASIGQIALMGGLILVVAIGAFIAIKQKGKSIATETTKL